MNRQTQRIYSEVYSVLDMLGEEFISKLPEKLYTLIKESRLEGYDPKYIEEIPLEEQAIKKESLSMLALFYLSYWCETDEEKDSLKTLFKQNAENLQKVIEVEQSQFKKNRTLTNDNKENKKTQEENIKIEENKKNNALVIQSKENIFRRIFVYIKQTLFKNQTK